MSDPLTERRIVELPELINAGFTQAQAELLERLLNRLAMRPLDPELTQAAREAFATRAAIEAH